MSESKEDNSKFNMEYITPTELEQHLRKQEDLKKYFMPAKASVSSNWFNPEYQWDVSLDKLADVIHIQSYPIVLRVARSVFIQMGSFIEKLKVHHCGLSHIQLSMFVLHEDILRISDTECLIKEDLYKNAAFWFGQCLYRFLSQQFMIYAGDPNAFKHPIFQSPEGLFFQNIISELIKTQDGIHVLQAVKRLKSIDAKLLKQKECAFFLLDSILSLRGTQEGTEAFNLKWKDSIQNADTLTIKTIYQQLEVFEKQEKPKNLQDHLLKIECRNLLDKILEIQPKEKAKFCDEDHQIIDKARPEELHRFYAELTAQSRVLESKLSTVLATGLGHFKPEGIDGALKRLSLEENKTTPCKQHKV